MHREKYYALVYRLLVWVWGQEPTISDRLLISHYAGHPLARSLSIRQRIVMFIIYIHLKTLKREQY